MVAQKYFDFYGDHFRIIRTSGESDPVIIGRICKQLKIIIQEIYLNHPIAEERDSIINQTVKLLLNDFPSSTLEYVLELIDLLRPEPLPLIKTHRWSKIRKIFRIKTGR